MKHSIVLLIEVEGFPESPDLLSVVLAGEVTKELARRRPPGATVDVSGVSPTPDLIVLQLRAEIERRGVY
jgi:hypothetical protein